LGAKADTWKLAMILKAKDVNKSTLYLGGQVILERTNINMPNLWMREA